jgi:hypothetical protein
MRNGDLSSAPAERSGDGALVVVMGADPKAVSRCACHRPPQKWGRACLIARPRSVTKAGYPDFSPSGLKVQSR